MEVPQIIIDVLVMFLLTGHVFKIHKLQDDNNRLWAITKTLLHRQDMSAKRIRELQQDLENIDSTVE